MQEFRSHWLIRSLALTIAALFCAGYPGYNSLRGLGAVASAAEDTRIAVLGVHGHPDSYEEDLAALDSALVEVITDQAGFEPRTSEDYGRSVWDRRTQVLQDVFLGSAQAALQEGRVLYDNAQFQGALTSLQKAEGAMERGIEFLRDPNLLVEIHLYEGLAQMALGNDDGAQEHFEAVARTDPARTLDPVRTPPQMIDAFEEAKLLIAEAGVAVIEFESGAVTGAEIFINGRRAGTTPTMLELAPGSYDMVVHDAEKGWDYQQEKVYAGDDLVLEFNLEPRGIRPLGREKMESKRSRRVQSLYRTLAGTVDSELLLLGSLDDGGNLHLQLYSPRSDIFSSSVSGMVMTGSRVDLNALDELVYELLVLTDGSGGIRPDSTSTTVVPLFIGRNPVLNTLLTGDEPDKQVVIVQQGGGEGNEGGGVKTPIGKRPGFWVILGTVVAGGVAGAVAGIAYSQQEPVMGNGTVTVVIDSGS